MIPRATYHYTVSIYCLLLSWLILCAFCFHCWDQFPSIVNIYYFFPVSALETLFRGGDIKKRNKPNQRSVWFSILRES